MKNGVKTGLLALAILSAPLMAQESSASFSHKDWEVVCDNTLTCRAAGYSPEEGKGGSVLLTRQAGAGTSVSGEVMLAEAESEGDTPVASLTLWINDQPAGQVKPDKEDNWLLSDKQTRNIVAAVKGSGKVEFKGGPDPFVLSGEGAYAVLLKMDDVQGRIGTPGALTKKGDKPESSVQAAIPAPVIQAVKVRKVEERPLTERETLMLKPRLIASLTENDGCDNILPSDDQEDKWDQSIRLTPIDNQYSLITALCWVAAYNQGYGYWVIDNKFKNNPVMVTDSGTSYSDGVISLAQKGRGLADCLSVESWVWDGKAFRQSHKATTGMCRYLRLGGTWDLPTWVTDVKPAK